MPTFNVNPVGPAGKQRMNNLSQIRTAFERLINEEGHRIAFWNDPDQESFMPVLLLEQKKSPRNNPGPAAVMSDRRRTWQLLRGFS